MFGDWDQLRSGSGEEGAAGCGGDKGWGQGLEPGLWESELSLAKAPNCRQPLSQFSPSTKYLLLCLLFPSFQMTRKIAMNAFERGIQILVLKGKQ